MSEEWKRAGEYHIERGSYTITRFVVMDCAKYMLWEGDEIRGTFPDVATAKRTADALDLVKENE